MRRRVRGRSGFTLLELLVVLVVMGLVSAIVAPQVMSLLSGAKSKSAALQIEALTHAISFYQLDTGDIPQGAPGLEALLKAPKEAVRWRGPYVRKRQSLTDPWGRPYQYRVPGLHGPYDLFTLGADGKEGGTGDDADVGNWDAQ